MYRSLMAVGLIIGLFYCSACTPTLSNMKIDYFDTSNMDEHEELIITTKNGSQYRLKQVEFTDTYIVGAYLKDEKNVTISFKDIASIKIDGARDIYGKRISDQVLKSKANKKYRIRLALTGGIIGLPVGWVAGFLVWRWTGSYDSPLPFGVLFGTVALSAYSGYATGKGIDECKAIEKIHREQLEK